MDPILHKQFRFAMKNRKLIIKTYDRIDLFKADVYSLGLTFLTAVTGTNISGINEAKEKE